ncbi:SNF7 family protein [Purpureocillium lilacinum]|nr:SNF7 family protein [Purpureocillium lilacinum]
MSPLPLHLLSLNDACTAWEAAWFQWGYLQSCTERHRPPVATTQFCQPKGGCGPPRMYRLRLGFPPTCNWLVEPRPAVTQTDCILAPLRVIAAVCFCLINTAVETSPFTSAAFWHTQDHPRTAESKMNILEWAFGKRMTPAERLRKNQRMLDKAIRELDQTRVKLEKQEKTLIQQIKTSAKNGQMGACKIQAKDLVRTRRYIEKFFAMRSQLQKISLRLQTYRTNEQMMQAMKGATMALGSMNKSMNLPQLQRIAMEFERENDIMEQRQEMMDDAVDDAMDVGVEEEGDEVVDQVLEEIGIDFNQALGETPTALGNSAVTEGKVAQAVGAGGGGGGDPVDDDLQARFDSLKK